MHRRSAEGALRILAVSLSCALACGGAPSSTESGSDGSSGSSGGSAGSTDGSAGSTDSSAGSTGAATTAAGPLAPPGEFSLLTYNVAGLPDGISSSDPVNNIPQISPLLNAFDLVLVQEDFYYHAELEADVTHPHHTTPWMEPPDILDLGDGLNRFSLFPFTDHDRTAWPDCNGTTDCASDCLATKGWSFARTTLAPAESGHEAVEVDVYNLHMEAGGCPEDLVIRQDSAEMIVDAIATRSPGRAVIVAGDFNLRETDPEDVEPLNTFLEGADLLDACTVLDCGDLRIDKIMYRDGDALTLEALTWEVPPAFVDAEGEDLSDHKPVAARFAYTPRHPG